MSPCPALPALLGSLRAQGVPGTAQLILTTSFVCGLRFCIFLLMTVGVPGTACPNPGCCAVPALWPELPVPLGCGRSLKSSSRIGKGATTSPWLRALLLLAQHTEGGVRRSLKLQKCGLLVETVSVGRACGLGRDGFGSRGSLLSQEEWECQQSQRMRGCSSGELFLPFLHPREAPSRVPALTLV